MRAHSEDVLDVLRGALSGTGLNLFGSAAVQDYDARASEPLQSSTLMPSALGVLVVGSAGRELWTHFGRERESGAHPPTSHPLDDYVARALDRADLALGQAKIGSRRFEPTIYASPSLDFCALGEVTGLGSLGPFGMLIHETHGPWWALRGAWLIDASVALPIAHRPPCVGCASPCIGGIDRSAGLQGVFLATPEVRARCVVGQASRYADEQIAHHYADCAR